MKNFDDLRNEQKKEDPSLAFSLEIVGKLMAKRNRVGISQRKLAKISGVSQKTISRIENGIDIPTFYTLSKLAYALGMKISVEDID